MKSPRSYVLALALACFGTLAFAQQGQPVPWTSTTPGQASLNGTANIAKDLNVGGTTTLNNLTVTGSTSLPPASVACNTLPAMTGDVTTNPTVTGCTTAIAPGAVGLSDMAPVAGNSLIGNPNSTSGTPSLVTVPGCGGALQWSGAGNGFLCAGPGQYPATPGGSSPSGAVIGEYASTLQTTNVPMPNGSIVDVASMSLAAGDWDCWAQIQLVPTGGTMTAFTAWTNDAPGTAPGSIQQTSFSVASATNGFASTTAPVYMRRYLKTSAWTLYLSAQTIWGTGVTSVNAQAHIACQRNR